MRQATAFEPIHRLLTALSVYLIRFDDSYKLKDTKVTFISCFVSQS